MRFFVWGACCLALGCTSASTNVGQGSGGGAGSSGGGGVAGGAGSAGSAGSGAAGSGGLAGGGGGGAAGGGGAPSGGSGGAAGGGGGAPTLKYPAAVLASGPASFFRFEEASGLSLADEKSTGIVGKLPSPDGGVKVTLNQPGAFPGSRALLLDANGEVDFGNTYSFQSDAPFTLTMFVKVAKYLNMVGAGASLLRKQAAQDGWRTEVHMTKGPGLFLYNGVSANGQTDVAQVKEQTWTYLAFRYDKTYMCVYVGEPKGSLTDYCKLGTTTVNTTSASMTLGGTTNGHHGWVDELAIFTKGLGVQELKDHFAAANADGLN
jgi:hypothetical protein